MWLAGDPVNGVGLALLVADVVALIWLLTNQRLRACFPSRKNNGTFGETGLQATLINKEGSEMKSLRLTLCAMPLLLTGCSTLSSVNWSAANPWNWFGSSTQVTEQGVGALTGATPLDEKPSLMRWTVITACVAG